LSKEKKAVRDDDREIEQLLLCHSFYAMAISVPNDPLSYSVTFQKRLPFLSFRAFAHEAVVKFFSNIFLIKNTAPLFLYRDKICQRKPKIKSCKANR